MIPSSTPNGLRRTNADPEPSSSGTSSSAMIAVALLA